MAEPTENPTVLLARLAEGDADAAERLLPLIYEELRAQADRHFVYQPANHTLQPTALTHEVFLRLIRMSDTAWRNRTHFMAVAATAMRQILADHARRKKAIKRGDGWKKVNLEEVGAPPTPDAIDLIALDEALAQLERLDPRRHRVVELRYFGGLTVDEAAELLGVSRTTIESDWRAARAWLQVQMGQQR